MSALFPILGRWMETMIVWRKFQYGITPHRVRLNTLARDGLEKLLNHGQSAGLPSLQTVAKPTD